MLPAPDATVHKVRYVDREGRRPAFAPPGLRLPANIEAPARCTGRTLGKG